MEEYFTEEHADACKKNPKKPKKPNPTHLHVWFRLILSFMLVSSALPRLLAAWGWAGVSCSSCTCRGLPVSTNNSLPAATWPTSKVPPLLCCGAISKVRQNEMGDKWGGAGRSRADKLQRCFIYCPERQIHWVFLSKLIRLGLLVSSLKSKPSWDDRRNICGSRGCRSCPAALDFPFWHPSSRQEVLLCEYVKWKCPNTSSPGSNFIISSKFELKQQAASEQHTTLTVLHFILG